MNSLSHMKKDMQRFPRQLWVILAGSLIFTVGGSMVWPYLNIYLQDKLDIPLRYSTLLISLRAFSGIAASYFAGSFADRFGRRFLVRLSLFGGMLYYLGLQFSSHIWQFALLMAFWGALDLCYPVGVNAMIADIVADEDRLEAYSLLRIVYNAGYAVGPIVGGILAASSYSRMFYSAATGYAISFVFMFFMIKETLNRDALRELHNESKTSFRDVLRDSVFIRSVALMGLIFVGTSGVFNLLSYYAGHNFGISESHISFVFTVNALVCVLGQMPAMRLSKRKPPLVMMIAAALFYVFGIAGYAVFPSVPWYCLCMLVMTIGEVLMTPTMSGLAARLAPEDARGRYMSVLSLAQPLGQGIGPAFLGYCYEIFSPRLMWVIGACFPLLAACGYTILNRVYGKSKRLRPF